MKGLDSNLSSRCEDRGYLLTPSVNCRTFGSWRSRKNRWIRAVALLELFFFFVMFIAPAFAQPQGGQVVSGSASISQPSAGTTNITQITNQAIINWQKFGINYNELVQFFQPSSLAVALNRVTGIDPTVILGSLKANGRIFLVNPNGILFGPTATVNVGGLVASTLSISDQDFLNGKYNFTQDQNHPLSYVVNQGTITANNGGYVVLLAPLVDNEGLIAANLGQVVLGAGTQASINFDGQGLINFTLQNSTAPPGDVVVDPQAFTQILNQVVNNRNILQASSVLNQNGKVVLAGSSGLAINAGTIQTLGAPGANAGNVILNSTQATALTAGSLITANGQGPNSNGGNIQVLSQGTTYFDPASTLQATGGSSGNGGFIEVSALQNVFAEGRVDASAEGGIAGTYLLDPNTMTICDGPKNQNCGSNTITSGTLENENVSEIKVQAANTITVDNITSNAGVIGLLANVSILLKTNNGDITFLPNGSGQITTTLATSGSGSNTHITVTSGGQAVLGNLTNLDSNGTVNVTATKNVSLGTLTANSSSGTVNVASIQGNILGNGAATNILGNSAVLSAAQGIGYDSATLTDKALVTHVANLQATNTSSGNINITDNNTAGHDLNLSDLTDESGYAVDNYAGNVSITENNTNLNVNNDVLASGSSFLKSANGNLNVNANVSAGTDNTLQANTDINLNSGNSAISAGNVNTITLTADYKQAGVGAVNQTDGQVGTAYENLVVHAGSGINLTNTDVAQLQATNTTSSDINVTDNNDNDGNLALNDVTNLGYSIKNSGGNVNITENNNDLNVNAAVSATGSTSLQSSSNDVNLNANVSAGTDNTIQANNNINVNSGTLSAGNGKTLTLTADSGQGGSGSLNQSGGQVGTGVENLVVYAGAGITLNNTKAAALQATNTTSNDINITDNGTNLALNDLTDLGYAISNQGGNVSITESGSNLTVNANVSTNPSTSGNITLQANNNLAVNGGQISGGSGNTITLAADYDGDGLGALSQSAGQVGSGSENLVASAGAGLTLSNTSVSALQATNSTSGDINVTDNSGSLQLNDVNGLGYSVKNSAGNVTVTENSGDITLNAGVSAPSAGKTVTFLATGGSLLTSGGASSTINASSLTLTAGNGIGTSPSPILAKLTNSLTEKVTGLNGSIYTNETSGKLANLNVTTNNGSVNVTSGARTLAFTGGASDVLSGTPSGINLNFSNTGGNLVLNQLNVGSSSTATLTASQALWSQHSDDTVDLQAQTASLQAGTNIGTNNRLNTNAGTLNATASKGPITILNSGSVILSNIQAKGTGNNVTVTNTTGNLLLGTVSAQGGVFLNALGGSILDNTNNASVNVTAGNTSSLTAGGGTLGTVSDPLRITVSSGALAIQAQGQAGGLSGNLTGSASPVIVSTSPSPPGQILFNGSQIYAPPSPTPASTTSTASSTVSAPSTVSVIFSVPASVLTADPQSLASSLDQFTFQIAQNNPLFFGGVSGSIAATYFSNLAPVAISPPLGVVNLTIP